MKKILFLALIAVFCVPCTRAEIILLKDGKSVRGKIAYEDKESIIVEKKDYRCITIYRTDIEEIKPDVAVSTAPAPVLNMDGTPTRAAAKKEKTVNVLGEQIAIEDQETIVRLGLSSGGTLDVSARAANGSGASGETSWNEDIKTGISLGAEKFYYTKDYMGIGAGLQYDLPRKTEDTDGRVSFLEPYAAFKLRYTPGKGNTSVYGVVKCGYGLMFADSDFKDSFGPDAKTTGGLYYGFGAGIQKNPFVFELLFSTNHGRVKIENYPDPLWGNVDLDCSLYFHQTYLSVGYVF